MARHSARRRGGSHPTRCGIRVISPVTKLTHNGEVPRLPCVLRTSHNTQGNLRPNTVQSYDLGQFHALTMRRHLARAPLGFPLERVASSTREDSWRTIRDSPSRTRGPRQWRQGVVNQKLSSCRSQDILIYRGTFRRKTRLTHPKPLDTSNLQGKDKEKCPKCGALALGYSVWGMCD